MDTVTIFSVEDFTLTFIALAELYYKIKKHRKQVRGLLGDVPVVVDDTRRMKELKLLIRKYRTAAIVTYPNSFGEESWKLS